MNAPDPTRRSAAGRIPIAHAAAPVCAFFMLLIALDRIAIRLRPSAIRKEDKHVGKP
jgi:hypothetical protein